MHPNPGHRCRCLFDFNQDDRVDENDLTLFGLGFGRVDWFDWLRLRRFGSVKNVIFVESVGSVKKVRFVGNVWIVKCVMIF